MMLNRQFILVTVLICFSFYLSKGQVIQVTLPEKELIVLEPYGTIQFDEIKECSGFVKSKNYPEIFHRRASDGR